MEVFDVFLSHNSSDKSAVETIAHKLKRAGLEPWLDKWYLVPGTTFQTGLVDALRNSATCAVFIGPQGMGDWSREEVLFAQDRATKEQGYRLIPILLPGVADPFDFSKLPPSLTQRTWVDFRIGVDDERPLRVLIDAIRGKAPGPDVAYDQTSDICPYQGLEVFDEEHAQFFFGRERDVQRLVEKLKTTRFLAVLGASGSGKSSLVRAGLIPALRAGALPQSETATICVFKPGSRPLTSLTAKLLHLSSGKHAMQTTLDQMEKDERTLHLAVALALADKPAGRIVWVIDQFEEVFTLCSDEKERASFLGNLIYASSIPDGQSTVLLTMRADFLPKCADWPDLAARVAAQQFLVSPMNADMLRHAIQEPARRVNLGFEAVIVDTILADVASEPGALPLVEHALLELWKRRRDHTLTLDGYRESGGVKGAIAKTAEETFKNFSPDEQTIVRRIMLRLTQLGEGTEDTRRRVAINEIVTTSSEAGAVQRVIKAMADARLLTTTYSMPDIFLDVSHEALIRGWPRLRQWLDEDRAGLRVHRRITETAEEWQGANRDDDLLYRGAKLMQAQEWGERHEVELNPLEREFLSASTAFKQRLEQQEREQQQRELQAAQKLAAAERKRAEEQTRATRRALLFATAALVVALVAAYAWFVAFAARSEADRQRKEAFVQKSEADSQRKEALVQKSEAERERGEAEKQQAAAETARTSAQQSRNNAVAAKRDADELINFMQYDLSDTLGTVGRLDMMNAINARIRKYHQDHPPEAGQVDALREQTVSLGQKGDILRDEGKLEPALKSYRDGLAIFEKLAKEEPRNAGLQRDLSVSYNKVGDVQSAQGDLAGALKSSRDSLAIFEKLAKEEPRNAGLQRDLSVSYNKVGDVQSMQGDLVGALKSYSDSLAIREKLAKQEPRNAGLQRDLSVSYNKVGDVQNAQGDLTGALKSSRDSLAIFEKLAKRDPGNAGWQADLAFSYWRTGTRLARSDPKSKKDARTMVENGRDILRELKTRTGLTRQQQQWLDSMEADLRK